MGKVERKQRGSQSQDAESSPELGEVKNEKCAHHSRFGTPSHTNAQCRLNKHIAQEANPNGTGDKKSAKCKFNQKKKEDDDNSSESDTDEAIQKEAKTQQRKGGSKFPKVQAMVNHTFLATPSARKIKQYFLEINATTPIVP